MSTVNPAVLFRYSCLFNCDKIKYRYQYHVFNRISVRGQSSQFERKLIHGAQHIRRKEGTDPRLGGRRDRHSSPTRRSSGLSDDRGYDNVSINAFAGVSLGVSSDIELSHWQASGNSEYVNTFFAPYPPLDQIGRAHV